MRSRAQVAVLAAVILVGMGCGSSREGGGGVGLGSIYAADFAARPAGEMEVMGGAARAVARKDGKGKWLRLAIDPPKAVGEVTVLRFRYRITGASEMIVQIFDATDQDNRHVVLRGLKQGAWESAEVNFTRDGRKNDGKQTVFAAGHLVDDLFFFVNAPAGGGEVEVLIDDVVLFDDAARRPDAERSFSTPSPVPPSRA